MTAATFLTDAWAAAFGRDFRPLTPTERRHFGDADVGGDPRVTEYEMRRDTPATDSEEREAERAYEDRVERAGRWL